MLSRKLRSSPSKKDFENADDRAEFFQNSTSNHFTNNTTIVVKAFLAFLSLWLLFSFYHRHNMLDFSDTPAQNFQILRPKCELGGYFYIHQLSEDFNVDLVKQCKNLSAYTDMCPHVANRGLGQAMSRLGWYRTHQFISELIFHARAENHPCRTYNPASATIFYIPFYGGLHASSMLTNSNTTARDELVLRLEQYLSKLSSWKRFNGADHFLALGRTAWDFMRDDTGPDYGANRLLRLPGILNMSILTVERHPWQGANQFGLPYPSYFHPLTTAELRSWQDRARRSNRHHLLSFIAGPRSGVEKAAVRSDIFNLCRAAAAMGECNAVQCAPGSSSCHDPDRVMSVMMESVFCAQPPGDSFTRRSVFDSLLAGCIPVFFSPHTAYSQYWWFLPEVREEYSVYVPAEEVAGTVAALKRIPAEKVARMREVVVEMIPRITYAHPNATDMGYLDAVDVALENLMAHVRPKLD